MAEWWEWTGEPGPWESNAAPDLDWGDFTRGGPGSWYGQETTDWANGPDDRGGGGGGGGGGNWLQSILASLGGPKGIASLLSGGASILTGQIGSNAARTASGQQSDALQRGIDLQTAQWLQQQQNQAPWLQAGRESLPELMRMAQQGEQAPFQGSAPIWGQHPGYAPPGATPGWQPQDYQGPQGPNAQDYRWTPGQGPRATDYRYTPGSTPDAEQYRSGPPQLYQGAKPGTQVSQLTGQQVLDQDPGAAFRQTEARKALEASAASRGGLMSGSTLGALQRQGQDLASQEYGNAFNRMMQRDVEQYGRDWGQYQQNWNEGVQGTQLNMATNAQNFGQAMSAAQLRESVNQQAQQMGWNQAQAEAAFREQMAQASSQQGWQQALQGQQNQFTQGLQSQQWNQGQKQQYETEMYNRMLQQAQERYGRDVSENQQTYDRSLTAYNSRQQNQATRWNRLAALSGVGQTAANQLGNQGLAAQDNLSRLLAQLGVSQGSGTAASALQQTRGITGAVNQLPSILSSLNR